MEVKKTGEVGVFQWNLPQTRGLLCSPEFHKFDRKWRLLLNDKAVALEFSQGVKPIHMDLRCVVIDKKIIMLTKSVPLATLVTIHSV